MQLMSNRTEESALRVDKGFRIISLLLEPRENEDLTIRRSNYESENTPWMVISMTM